jgi:hypothetical protein
MDAFVETLNLTGNFFVDVLHPVPVDVIGFCFLILACWVWVENGRVYVRWKMCERRALERSQQGDEYKDD